MIAIVSDSESDDTLDLDSIGKTENLSHGAALHKRNVRPRHRAKSRRVSAAPAQMVSVGIVCPKVAHACTCLRVACLCMCGCTGQATPNYKDNLYCL